MTTWLGDEIFAYGSIAADLSEFRQTLRQHGLGDWADFTAVEQHQINLDALRSAEVLFRDLPRPPQVNEHIHRAVALEQIERFWSLTPDERQVVTPLGTYTDALDFAKAYRKRRIEAPQLIDDPSVIGAKYLILYGGNPRVVVPVDDLNEWPYVAELLRQRCTRKPLCKCDIGISTRCTSPMVCYQVIHYKVGQYLVISRACNNCAGYLMDGSTPAKGKRLTQLLTYIEAPDVPPNLRTV